MTNHQQQTTEPLPEPYAFMAKTIMLPYALPPEGVESLLIVCRKIYEIGIMEGKVRALMPERERKGLDSEVSA